MRVVIAGSRSITEMRFVEKAIELSGWRGEIETVICGMAAGVDTLGSVWAFAHDKYVLTRPAEWRRHGRAAGHMRNAIMATDAAPDGGLILVWDGQSRGSASMKLEAAKKGLRKFELLVNEQYPEGMPI